MRSDFLDMIKEIIWDETRYMRHYYGTVLNNIDPLEPNSGAVIATCDELGWDTPDKAARVLPRFMHSMSVPNKGEAIEIYFMDGDPEKPRYFAQAQDIFGNRPTNYKLPTDHVVIESPILKQYIKVDDLTGTITISPTLLTKLGLGTNAMVLGTALLAWITSFITSYNLHVHGGVTPGPNLTLPPSVPQSPPTGVLSLKHFLD